VDPGEGGATVIDAVKEEALAHALRDSPREACGLAVIVKGRVRYVPCRNLAAGTEHFELAPEDYANAEDLGEIVAVIHSHPNAGCNPSQADLISCERSGIPWAILALPSGQWASIRPTGYKAPLVGRVFSHGVLDCYTLIRDYYFEVLNVTLPDFYRPAVWWDKKREGGALNLYVDNFEKAGFVRVDRPLQKHDVLLMQVESDVPNHAAIYLGDEVILHHLYGRLSSRDVYGGMWQKHKTHVLEYAHG